MDILAKGLKICLTNRTSLRDAVDEKALDNFKEKVQYAEKFIEDLEPELAKVIVNNEVETDVTHIIGYAPNEPWEDVKYSFIVTQASPSTYLLSLGYYEQEGTKEILMGQNEFTDPNWFTEKHLFDTLMKDEVGRKILDAYIEDVKTAEYEEQFLEDDLGFY